MKEEAATFQSLFHQYYPQLHSYVSGIVGAGDAEDIVEDVFEELWSRREGIEIGDKIGGFLYRSALSHSLNHLRHKGVTDRHVQMVRQINEVGLRLVDGGNTAQDHLEREELRATLMKAINELPDKCREVFKLSYLHGMKSKDIGDVLGISTRTVDAHIYTALKALRKRLQGIDWLFLIIFFNFCLSSFF